MELSGIIRLEFGRGCTQPVGLPANVVSMLLKQIGDLLCYYSGERYAYRDLQEL
jgi:hypothetical protein